MLPPTFAEVRAEVTAILKKMAGGLNIRNADDSRTVYPNRAVLENEEFKELWNRIKARTTYEVEVDTSELIKQSIKALNDMPVVPRTRVQTTTATLEMNRGGIQVGDIETHAPTTLQENDLELPDLLGALQDRTELTRRTLSNILRGSERLSDFKKNPQAFIELAATAINARKVSLLVSGIKYNKSGEEYAQSLLEDPITTLGNVMQVKKGAYDHVIYDSDVEKAFAQQLEQNANVKVYAKLPNWFRVPTPLGDYNPDWAILLQLDGQEKLCFVAETKGTLWTGALREKEVLKIDCGKEHFAVLAAESGMPLKYEVVRELDDVFERTS